MGLPSASANQYMAVSQSGKAVIDLTATRKKATRKKGHSRLFL
jgi:hypothetical protein